MHFKDQMGNIKCNISNSNGKAFSIIKIPKI